MFNVCESYEHRPLNEYLQGIPHNFNFKRFLLDHLLNYKTTILIYNRYN